jgi:hypothetical protein
MVTTAGLVAAAARVVITVALASTPAGVAAAGVP